MNCLGEQLDSGFNRKRLQNSHYKHVQSTKGKHAKEVKKGMITVSHQIKDINKAIEIILKDKLKFRSLKIQ